MLFCQRWRCAAAEYFNPAPCLLVSSHPWLRCPSNTCRRNCLRKKLLCCLLISAVISSCAHVSEYTLAIQYVPQKHVPTASARLQNQPITVAMFTDGRTVDNTAYIGEKVPAEVLSLPNALREKRPQRLQGRYGIF